MAYRETNYYTVTNANNVPIPVTIHRVSTNRTNHIVDYKYTPRGLRSFEECIANPTNRPGYEVVAAINVGAYNEAQGSIIGSLQVRNSSNEFVEYTGENDCNDNTRDFGIVNDKLECLYINGTGQYSMSSNGTPDMLRSAYRFSMNRVANGTMTVVYSSKAETDAKNIYNERAVRVGLGFTANDAYFLFVETAVTGNELKQALEQAGYLHYVNLDGGRSSHMYADGEIYRFPAIARDLYECLYLMKRVEEVDITGYAIYVNQLGLNVRSEPNANSICLDTAKVGEELKIRYFLPGFQSDGYQWAAVWFNGHSGYSQIDTYGYYTILETSSSIEVPYTGACKIPDTLYLMTSSSGAYMRTEVVTGTRTFIPANTKVKVVELLPNFQSDGYQWVKVEYNGSTGYVQADVKSWHYFTTD